MLGDGSFWTETNHNCKKKRKGATLTSVQGKSRTAAWRVVAGALGIDFGAKEDMPMDSKRKQNNLTLIMLIADGCSDVFESLVCTTDFVTRIKLPCQLENVTFLVESLGDYFAKYVFTSV